LFVSSTILVNKAEYNNYQDSRAEFKATLSATQQANHLNLYE